MGMIKIRACGGLLIFAAAFLCSAAEATPPIPARLRIGDGPDRAFHTLVHDPGNDYYWIFGGLSADVAGSEFQNTVFERSAADDDSRWLFAPIPGLRPPNLAFHTAVFDPVRRRMIVAGGLIDRRGFVFAETISGDSIWWLDLTVRETARWANRIVPGNGTPRFGHAAVYVPEFDAMIISGGFSTFSSARSDHFALLLGEDPMRWVRLPDEGFSPRGGHALIWDAAAQRLVAYGGTSSIESIAALDDILALDLSGGLESATGWVTVAPASLATPEAESRGRAFAAHGFDPDSRLWWFHGGARSSTEILRDVDVLDLSVTPPEWTGIGASELEPAERFGNASAWDAERRRLLVHGGSPDNVGTRPDTWALVIPDPPPTPTLTATPDTTATDLSPTATATPTPTATREDGTDPPPTTTATRDAGTEPPPTPEFRSIIRLPWLARNAGG